MSDYINTNCKKINLIMSKVLAKLKCRSMEHTEGDYKTVKMYAVMDGDGENGDFNKYTPSGSFEMCISPETKANEYFEVGNEYYFNISKAPKTYRL